MKETSYRENPRKELQLPTTWDRVVMWMKGFFRVFACIFRVFACILFTHPHLVLCAIVVMFIGVWIHNSTDPVGECYFKMEFGGTVVYVTEPLAPDRSVAVVYVEGDDLKQNQDALQIVSNIGCKYVP